MLSSISYVSGIMLQYNLTYILPFCPNIWLLDLWKLLCAFTIISIAKNLLTWFIHECDQQFKQKNLLYGHKLTRSSNISRKKKIFISIPVIAFWFFPDVLCSNLFPRYRRLIDIQFEYILYMHEQYKHVFD